MRRLATPLAELAARQHGVVSVQQLAELGVGEAMVRRWVADARLHRVHRGVYAVGHARLTREGRWLAAVLGSGPGAALSHRSAAALWGLRPTAAARVEVRVPRTSGYRSNRAVIVRRPVGRAKTTVRDAIPVTTPTQTLIDLSSVLPSPALQRALEAADSLRLLDVNGLPPRLQELAGAIEPRLRSPLEAQFLDACRGLPQPRVNALVEGFEVDFSWPDQRLIVETDGHRHHGTRAAFERDLERDAQLTAAGWRVVRVTHRRLVGHPEEVKGLLGQLLSGRSPSRATPG